MAWAQPAALANGWLSGTARLTVFGFEVYTARLWVTPGFQREQYTQHALALELTYLRNFKGRAIAERSLKEMRRVEPFTDTQAQTWLAALTQTIPDVTTGDRLTGLYQPGQGLRLLFNGAPLPELSDPVLARVFIGIWLSPHTSEPAMRDRLLMGAAP